MVDGRKQVTTCLDYMFFLELIKKTSGCKFV